MASVLTTPSFSLLCTRGEEDELPNLQPGQSSAVLWWFASHWHPHSSVVNLISFGFLFWRPIYCWYPRPCYRTESHTQEHIPCHQMQVSTWGSWEWISREQQGAVGRLGGQCPWLDHCHLWSLDCAFLWNPSGQHARFVFWYGQQVFPCWRAWVCHSLHRHTLQFVIAADLRLLELNFQGHNTVEWSPISDLHLQDDDESKSIWGGGL